VHLRRGVVPVSEIGGHHLFEFVLIEFRAVENLEEVLGFNHSEHAVVLLVVDGARKRRASRPFAFALLMDAPDRPLMGVEHDVGSGRLLGTRLVTQADTCALTLQFAVGVVGWIEFQTVVLARDARIIVGIGGLGDYPVGPD
jgi:hypothetical protein